MPVDLQQKISAVLVATPVNAGGTRHEVRVTFYCVVWKGDGWVERQAILPGEQKMEMISDPEVYQLFFAGLSKALFLEAFTL
ncbi:hypothetical protein LPW11_03065 [Geomonas sp. RF6]|uniref:hypothetical protein n=1 Tax=Geomonas sp. RF6 TaxID=2897342 RepID=UPI001E552662|nr:hypothetical protein [Geomonas sp. RF6]UFS71180.1 hypothetical protein LPW11_03065 [Geomonas sp. RF6]